MKAGLGAGVEDAGGVAWWWVAFVAQRMDVDAHAWTRYATRAAVWRR